MSENKNHPLQRIDNKNHSDWLQKLENATRKPLEKGTGQFLSASSNLDIVFSFDTTGSMYSYLEEVQRNLSEIIFEIKTAIPNSLLGVVAYGDYCDEGTTYLTKTLHLSNDINQIKKFVTEIERTGGGDLPEALEVAICKSVDLKWRHLSKKAMVIVGDAPPHGVIDEMINQINYKVETSKLKNLGVKLYTVQCGNDKSTEQTFKWLAETTGGVYLNLNNIHDLKDILIGATMKEVGLLDKYITKLSEGKSLCDSKQKILKQLNGK
jgi:hypothetical protein